MLLLQDRYHFTRGHWSGRNSIRIAAFALFVAFFAIADRANAGPLTGNYRVVESTERGEQIQITLQFNFVNPGTDSVKVTSVGVYSRTKPGPPMFVPAILVVQSHSTASTTVTLSMRKADFASWFSGPHQLFAIKTESASGKLVLENIPLMRTKE